VAERATAGSVDGRRARGERTRAALIAATLQLVEREGVAKVTHRAVALEAGVATGAATYYFSSLDDLLVAALSSVAEDYSRQLGELVAGGLDELAAVARLIAAVAGPGRQRGLAESELNLLAARRPALRATARHWRDTVTAIARRCTDDEQAVQDAVAAAEGLCIRLLLGEVEFTEEQVLAVLRHALRVE
jgi:TetR/AcrR family transcriptional regulator, regulator of biofilm formation and stress response